MIKPVMQYPTIKLNASIPLVKYMQKIKEVKTKNLMDSFGDLPPSKETEEEAEGEEVDKTYYSHFKKELYLYVVIDNTYYKASDGIPLP